jgi:hypothetical protein
VSNPQFALKPLLDNLRVEFGDSSFGYRVQALFAHVLIRLGVVILEINRQGHPDIRAKLGGDVMIVQVKSIQHASHLAGFQLTSADLAGIVPAELTKGYLALLDCADPVSWIIVEHSKACQFVDRPSPMAGLRAAAELQISQDCTEEFTNIILLAKDRLNVLTYPLLVRRALDGKGI